MARITVNETGSFATLQIISNGTAYADAATAFSTATADTLDIPTLQDVTFNASPGTFTWEQLNSTSQFVVTTPSTNSVSLNMVLDTVSFFDGAGSTPGIWEVTNDKSKVYFRLYMNGTSSGDYYVEGEGYLSGLAPTVSPTAPVWVSPMEIVVDGEYTQGTVAP